MRPVHCGGAADVRPALDENNAAHTGAASAGPRLLRRRLVDIPGLIVALGLREGSRPQRGGLLVRCPAHRPDRHPSCSVRCGADGAVYFRCFACGVSGDVLTLIALVQGIDLKSAFPAVLRAARDLAVALPAAVASDVRPVAKERADHDSSNAAAISTFLLERCVLSEAEQVCMYLRHRRVFEQAVADGWGALPETPESIEGLVDDMRAEFGSHAWRHCGFAGTAGTLSYPEHRLVIPWRNADGAVSTVQRRCLQPRDGEPRYVFPRGSAPLLPYGVEHVRAGVPLVIVEGAIDVLAMRALCGAHRLDRFVLGLPGTSSWRSAWAELARERDVLIGVDADTAGQRCATIIARDVLAAGAKSVTRVTPRHGNDWADFLEVTP